MHDDHVLIERRLERVLRERIRPAVYADATPLDINVWQTPGEPVPVDEALAATGYAPARVGDAWGPPWSTCWFRVSGTVPAGWSGRSVEAVIELTSDKLGWGPGFQAEALAYTVEGAPVKGLHPRSTWLPVADRAKGGEEVTFFIEAAANPPIERPVTPLGDLQTAGREPMFRIVRMDLAVFDRTVWELVQDLEVLCQLMRELSLDDPRRWELLRAIERSLDALDLRDVAGSADAARSELGEMLARPAHASAHRVSAVGHAHIDSAWLWPQRETIRKVARTAANVTALMDDHPDFRFAMSQAQQLAWIKEDRPEVYARVRDQVKAGRFVPVGGMWVESDTNMPGGEALARQFVHGKRFYLDEFGVETEEVWLPDSFGYTGALPQLIRLSGSRWFLSQKMSWNQTNRFPHHSFLWEGIDGTRVFTHFPPVDTYNSQISGEELARAARNFADKGNATRSLAPFGWGDGGGGPTREMLARAARTADLEGSPRVVLETPADFFRAAEAEYVDPPVWSGEMYLEFHRGTYTSQARTKAGNRRSEHLLREAELWSATAAVAGVLDYPYDQLDRIWKVVLLHQFHDILPGSSIAWVHREAEATYARVAEELERLIDRAVGALAGGGEGTVVFNAAPHARDGIAAMGTAPASPPAGKPVVVAEADGAIVLENGLVRITIDGRGLVSSLLDLDADRELIPAGGAANLLQIHPDLPNDWDAWDVDAFYRHTRTDLVDADEVTVVERGPGSASVRVVRRFGASTVTQLLSLVAGEPRLDVATDIDWRERETFLKAAFPLDVHADRSASEIQFGHVFRATHENTSWDAARFEICAHRWLHVGEPGFGVAIVNDAKYGHDVTRTTREDGGTTTTVRLSLLRAPRYPDPDADQGRHRFRYAMVAGAGIVDAVREGYRINLPERRVPGSATVEPLVAIDDPGVVVEAVKLADDRSGDLVVRLYEALGRQARARLTPGVQVTRAELTDLLERPLQDADPLELAGGAVALRLRPFQVLTVRLARQ